MDVTLILNRSAGALRGRDPERAAGELAETFRSHGHSVTTEIHAGATTAAALARTCREQPCEAVVVAGGDGTASAAASVAAEGGFALGILPLGTMNLFARSLGIPLEMKAAAEALAAGSIRSVDIGEVNGRLFLHHVTLGLHPRIIKTREELNYASSVGKIWANVQAWWITLGRPSALDASIRIGDRVVERQTAAILVTNNPLGERHLPYADDLTQGELGLYIPSSRRWHDLIRITAQITIGEIASSKLLESWRAGSIGIVLPETSADASVDGEIVRLRMPIELKVRKGGLKVLQPQRRLRPEELRSDQPGSRPPGPVIPAKEGTAPGRSRLIMDFSEGATAG